MIIFSFKKECILCTQLSDINLLFYHNTSVEYKRLLKRNPPFGKGFVTILGLGSDA